MHSVTTYNFKKIQNQLKPRFGFTFTVIHVRNVILHQHPNQPIEDKISIASAMVVIQKDGLYVCDCAVIVNRKGLASPKLHFSLSFNNKRMKYRKVRRFESELNKDVLLNEAVKARLTKF